MRRYGIAISVRKVYVQKVRFIQLCSCVFLQGSEEDLSYALFSLLISRAFLIMRITLNSSGY